MYLKIMLVLLVLVFGLHCCMPVHIIKVPTTGTHQNCPSQNITESIKETLKTVVNSYLDDRYRIMCGGPGWRRIAYLDMNSTYSQCPSEWRLHTDRVRGCGRNRNASYTCDSVYFRNNGLLYSRVCGRITAYQKSFFYAFYSNIIIGRSIDSAYASGVLVPDNIFGHLLVLYFNKAILLPMPGSFVPVLYLLIPGLIKFHHLSVTIIFVTLEILGLILVLVLCTLMTHYGMEQAVPLLVRVASSTTLHGLTCL